MEIDITSQLEEILEEYGDNVKTLTAEAEQACAKAAAKELKSSSPVGTGPKAGRYARGWRSKETEDGWVTYNATDPQLTHLLENGHDLYVHGRYIRFLQGQPHIKAVEEKMVEKFQETIERKLK